MSFSILITDTLDAIFVPWKEHRRPRKVRVAKYGRYHIMGWEMDSGVWNKIVVKRVEA